jgi:adenylosuccinate lyase
MSGIHPLLALSPIDGRYSNKTQGLAHITSEYGLIYYRSVVEIRWLQHLCQEPMISEAPSLTAQGNAYLNAIIENFSIKDAESVKTIEKTTNHDVKAVEYFLQEKLKAQPELATLIPFIHFGCTSEDINNVAYALMWRDAQQQIQTAAMQPLDQALLNLTSSTRDMAMLSRTHGQTASPTTLGKEIANIRHRYHQTLQRWSQLPVLAKFNGAVGNFNAHVSAYPELDWCQISQRFIQSLDLTWQSHTTQIEPHDALAESLHGLMRINTILIDMSRDIWGYISLGYFRQKSIAGEVGSSTMPHKVNPIDFENAEGNLGLANALAAHMASKLPCSRWQRDLTDSTVMRNLGTVLGYSLISYQSLLKGLNKLEAQAEYMADELAQHWEVLAEPIQTVMRRFGIEDAYEQLKALTRGSQITQKDLSQLIESLNIPSDAKQALLDLTPNTYIGLALQLVDRELADQ